MDRPITKRALRKAATRVAVIEAAREVFQDRGYERATIAEIAKAAEVSPGTVLNAASSKIALLNAVMVEDFKQLGSDGETLRKSLSCSFEDSILALVELHLQRHCNELDLVTALIGHMWLDGGEEFAGFQSNMAYAWGPMVTLIKAEEKAGRLRDGVSIGDVVAILQDIYIGIIRRCASRELDMFSASTLMRRHASHVLSGLVIPQ